MGFAGGKWPRMIPNLCQVLVEASVERLLSQELELKLILPQISRLCEH